MARRHALSAVCALLLSGAVGACGDSGSPAPLTHERTNPAAAGSGGRGSTGAQPGSRTTPGTGPGAAPSGGVPGPGSTTPKKGPLPPQGKREVALVQTLVAELVRGLDEGDPSICSRLYDQRLVQRGRRAAVVEACRRQTAAAADRSVKLVAIEDVRIVRKRAGTLARVQFVLESEGRRFRYRFRLRRSGDRPYRIDAALPVKQP